MVYDEDDSLVVSGVGGNGEGGLESREVDTVIWYLNKGAAMGEAGLVTDRVDRIDDYIGAEAGAEVVFLNISLIVDQKHDSCSICI